MTQDFDNEIYKSYLAGLSSAEYSDLMHSWHMPDKVYSHSYIVDVPINQKVHDKWGSEMDKYLKMTYPMFYNEHTKVEIIANAQLRFMCFVWGYVPFEHITSPTGSMLIAYVDRLNTLFVRTLFDVIRTPDNPDDIMDIEARLGL